jgi:hypothetical protein
MLVTKLFKLLSLLKLLREVRHALRGRGGHGAYHGQPYRGDHWHPRSRDYHPLYRRPRKPKLKHLVRDLLSQRRY